MKKIFYAIILTPFLISSSFADALADLTAKINNIQSMSADFSQRMIDNQNGANFNTEGSMELKKPSFFRWATKTPNNQEIISNGKKLWFYDEDLDQLVIKNVSNNISEAPYLILLSKNSDKLSQMFAVKKLGDNGFVLTPKGDDTMIDDITIRFDKNDNLLSLNIGTSLHQFTTIAFSDIKTNQADLKDDIFEFTAPKGTDVIDETK